VINPFALFLLPSPGINGMDWLKVSLTVSDELAEAVAEVLARFAPGGVVFERMQIADELDGIGAPTGPMKVSAYLPVDEQLEDTRSRLEQALWFMGRIQPLPSPYYEAIEEMDWMAAWRRNFRPIPVGERLLILPAWMEPTQGERIPIRIDPGMAFGTGAHPSTQLCLRLIEELLSERARIAGGSSPQLAMIDVGCGSGILSVAALKLGVRQSLGVDTDPQAIDVARATARLNQVDDQLELGVGSVAEIRAGRFSITQAPLVLANILAPTILSLLGNGLGELVSPEGVLVLSGILDSQVAEVERGVARHCLVVSGRLQQEDWVALTCRPQPK
jgi:ribosomal protein L11 methyltransferase